jgi:hypothetical protein
MHAVSRTTTSLFTSSGGGFIGLQLAASYPAVLDHLIIHEAPILSLLPAAESTALIDLSFELRALYKREGVEKAMEKFQEGMVGMDDGLPMAHPGTANQVNQYEYELPWMALYCPDLEKVKGCSVLVSCLVLCTLGVADGDRSAPGRRAATRHMFAPWLCWRRGWLATTWYSRDIIRGLRRKRRLLQLF